jgi:pimeloyl-ACP methyl ester carboxylesterase
MAPVGRELADEFATLEPLQRRSGVVPLTVAQHVADLHECLSRVERPAILVGSSWGAMLGLTYAARCPWRVAKIVAIGCGTYNREARRLFHQQMAARVAPAVAPQRESLLEALAVAKDPATRGELFSKIIRIDTRTQAYDPITDELEIIASDVIGQRETWSDVVRLQESGLQPAEFAAITAPVVMLHGDSDPHDGPLIRDALQPFVRDLTYIELERCGHIPWIERHAREEFFQELRRQLRSV